MRSERWIWNERGACRARTLRGCIFYDKTKLDDLPFYIDKIPCEGYASDDELRQKLEKFRIPS